LESVRVVATYGPDGDQGAILQCLISYVMSRIHRPDSVDDVIAAIDIERLANPLVHGGFYKALVI